MPDPRLNDIMLSLVKAKINGNFPDVTLEEVDFLEEKARAIFGEDAALAAMYVGKGVLAVNVADHGVIPDGTDVMAALNSIAATVYATKGTLYIPPGTYRIDGKVKIRCNLYAAEALFHYYGNGDALVIGEDIGLNQFTGNVIAYLPSVYNMSRVDLWDGTSVGVRLVNLNNQSKIYGGRVQDFDRGMVSYGQGGGFAYNDIWIGYLLNNRINLHITSDETGWSNQNNYYGGRYFHGSGKGSFIGNTTSAQIQIDVNNNNNAFYNPSLESSGYPYWRLICGGRYNHFLNARWETIETDAPRIKWTAGASSNIINRGYDAWKIEETFEGGAVGGVLLDGGGSVTATNSGAGQTFTSGTSYSPITAWVAAGTRCDLTSVAGTGEFTPRPGKWRIRASVAFTANAVGVRGVQLKAGGSVFDVQEGEGQATTFAMKVETTYLFNGTNTFQVLAKQNSGADLALVTSSPWCRLEAEYLGK